MKIAYDPRYHALYLKLGAYNPQHTIACRDRETSLKIGKKILFSSLGGGKETIEYF